MHPNTLIRHSVLFLVAVFVLTHSVFAKTTDELPAQSGQGQVLLADKVVETSYLPLTLKYVSNLNASGVAGMGGSLFVGASGVVLMDRTGQFYSVKDKEPIPLNLKTPSNHELFLKENPKEKIVAGVINATSFTFDPVEKKIYAAHNQYLGADQVRMLVSSVDFDADALKYGKDQNWTTIFEGPPVTGDTRGTDASAGKVLLVGRDLFLSTGFPGHEDAKSVNGIIDAGSLALTPPQNVNTLHSKVIKISLKDNSSEVYASGQRNSQGMVLTSGGEILSTDHGPQGGDEINRLRQGANYGHPIQTYGTRYGTYDYAWPAELMDKVPKDQKFDLPVFAFVPSIAINPIIEIKSFNERLKGDLLIGSLKAQSLYRLKYIDGRVIFSEPIWLGHRIRDIYEYQNKIYLLTDEPYLISLEVDTAKLSANKTKDDKYFLSPTVQNKCMNCHSFNPTLPSSMAPKLSNIIGKKLGSDTFDRYSAAFKNSGLVWTKENLAQFLRDPAAVVPGTSMPKPNLTPDEVNELVEIIAAYK